VLVESEDDRKECINNLFNKLFRIDETNKIKKAVDEQQNKIDVNNLLNKIQENLFDCNCYGSDKRYVTITSKCNSKDSANKNCLYPIILDFLKYSDIKSKSYITLKYKKNENDMNPSNVINVSELNKEYLVFSDNKKKIEKEKFFGNFDTFIQNPTTIYNKLKEIKEFGIMIENIKSDITQLVDKFNRNYSNIANVSKYSSNQLLAIDINVDKAVKEMKTIIGIFKDIEDKKIVFDDKNTQELNTTFKQIMNAVDSLKTFFSESSIRENRITGVTSIQIKLEKILKKSNEIKALQLVQQYLFSDFAKGIYLYYDDEKTESSEILKGELKKDKYSFFTNTVKYIKDNFLNVESTNKELTKLMRYYFENTGNGFIEKVVGPAKQTINENIIKENNLLNIGVTKITSNKENIPMYEINIYMEVIIGQVDYQKQQKIKCEYRDEKLLAYFDKFASNPKNYEIIKKKAIRLKDDGTENVENKKNTNKANNENKTKGGKTTRKKKYLQNNKRYTSKRR
jgi:hypothetical protein